MFEVEKNLFNLSPDDIRFELDDLFDQTTQLLDKKGISYRDLKSALTPTIKRKESAFIFDTAMIDNPFYGYEIQNEILPLFHAESNHSVLVGDLSGGTLGKRELRSKLLSSLNKPRDQILIDESATRYHAVYINNLSPTMLEKLDCSLKKYQPYIGYLDCTYSSPMKTYLSFILCNSYIKFKSIIIEPHEDDLDEEINQNTKLYPFEEHGFLIRSVPSTMFDVLLSYKIERAVYTGLESDNEISLNSISLEPSSFDGYQVVVDPNKFDYLLEKKSNTLKKAGFSDLSISELQNVIRERLRSNYLFHLTWDEEHDTASFNTILEFQRTGNRFRLLASFEYKPREKIVRLITAY